MKESSSSAIHICLNHRVGPRWGLNFYIGIYREYYDKKILLKNHLTMKVERWEASLGGEESCWFKSLFLKLGRGCNWGGGGQNFGN